MNKFIKFLENRQAKSEERLIEERKWNDLKNDIKKFDKTVIDPTLKSIKLENREFAFHKKNTEEDFDKLIFNYDLVIEDNTNQHQYKLNVVVKLNNDKDNVKISVGNCNTGHKVDEISSYQSIDKAEFEDILIELLIQMYNIDEK